MFFSSSTVLAQNITAFTYRLSGDSVLISYNLSGKASDLYAINLYRSTDDFSEPLRKVSGDIGSDIQPGRGKTIIWRAKDELGEFKGNLSLKLRAVFVPLVAFDIAKGNKYRRGKAYEITWQYGGSATDVKLELYQGNRKVSDLVSKINDTSYHWDLPKTMDLADGYYFKASGAGREAKSTRFSVKRKIPMAAWIVPGVLVIGGVTYLILNAGTDSGNEIPDPILPN